MSTSPVRARPPGCAVELCKFYLKTSRPSFGAARAEIEQKTIKKKQQQPREKQTDDIEICAARVDEKFDFDTHSGTYPCGSSESLAHPRVLLLVNYVISTELGKVLITIGQTSQVTGACDDPCARVCQSPSNGLIFWSVRSLGLVLPPSLTQQKIWFSGFLPTTTSLHTLHD